MGIYCAHNAKKDSSLMALQLGNVFKVVKAINYLK